jgi:hypothetical protein
VLRSIQTSNARQTADNIAGLAGYDPPHAHGQPQMLQSRPTDVIAVATGFEVCIYSAHQDSATINAGGPSTASMRALSSVNDSAIIRGALPFGPRRDVGRVGDDIEGVPNVFYVAGRVIQTARPVVACLQHS